MDFVEALKTIEGAQSVGGQLIVHRGGRNIVVGKQVQGALIVAETDEAKAIMAEVTISSVEIAVDSTGEPLPEPGPVVPKPEPTPLPAPEAAPAPAPASRRK